MKWILINKRLYYVTNDHYKTGIDEGPYPDPMYELGYIRFIENNYTPKKPVIMAFYGENK